MQVTSILSRIPIKEYLFSYRLNDAPHTTEQVIPAKTLEQAEKFFATEMRVKCAKADDIIISFKRG